MSDEFDKEAEREKLRRQLEEEEEDRETTQRMSELLLKGATMTNRHCEECGDPIFRWQGEAFCPTCQRTVEEMEAGEADATGTATDAVEAEGDAAAPDAEDPAGEAASADDRSVAGDTPTRPVQPAPDTEGAAEPSGEAADDLGAARASLVRTLVGLARRAEATDDPRRARELLAAARAAAEAIEAIDAARR